MLYGNKREFILPSMENDLGFPRGCQKFNKHS
jgi:hypothetical protein